MVNSVGHRVAEVLEQQPFGVGGGALDGAAEEAAVEISRSSGVLGALQIIRQRGEHQPTPRVGLRELVPDAVCHLLAPELDDVVAGRGEVALGAGDRQRLALGAKRSGGELL